MIALSSGSYTFENLYKQYKEWVDNIYSKDKGEASYFISQMGYESLPKHMIDRTIIEEAESGGQSPSSFQEPPPILTSSPSTSKGTCSR